MQIARKGRTNRPLQCWMVHFECRPCIAFTIAISPQRRSCSIARFRFAVSYGMGLDLRRCLTINESSSTFTTYSRSTQKRNLLYPTKHQPTLLGLVWAVTNVYVVLVPNFQPRVWLCAPLPFKFSLRHQNLSFACVLLRDSHTLIVRSYNLIQIGRAHV